MLTKNPNAAHMAIAECEERLSKQGREVTVITQNIDELHRRAGSKNILEIHGMLTEITTHFLTTLTKTLDKCPLARLTMTTLSRMNVSERWVVVREAVDAGWPWCLC